MTTPTLADLQDEMAKGRIYEVSLRDKHWHLDGLQEGSIVYIDPRPNIIETLLHELLHRRYPKFSERTVDRTAKKLMGTLTNQDLVTWWKAYRKIVKKGRPVDADV